MKKRQCYRCNSYDISEDHHLIPQARGGKDGPRIDLCVKHHKEAHYLARSKIRLTEISNSKMRKIVQIIRLSEQTLDPAENIRITLEIPRKLHTLIKEEATKGKKKSIPKMITLILVRYFRKKVR